MPRPLVVSFVLLASTLVACPPAEKHEEKKPTAACTKIGESCEVSPGKLGSCVARDDCAAGSAACFTCQSQH